MISESVRRQNLNDFAKRLVSAFAARQIVLLNGPLGAGKTQLVKECAQVLGAQIPESPTFSLINEYASKNGPVHHVDLYRLNSDEDIDSTGFWDLFREEKGLIFVEWAEKIPQNMWPLTWRRLNLVIEFTEKNDERKITVAP